MPTEITPVATDGTLATYSIDEAALILRGNATITEIKWLRRKLNQGEFAGYKAARKWRMTATDIQAAIAKMRPTPQIPDLPDMAGLTRTSRRRISA